MVRLLCLVSLLLVLPACGERVEHAGAPATDARYPAPGSSELRVRVLDPAGRIFQHPAGALVLLRDPTGHIERGPTFSSVPEGSSLAVIAPGCAVFEGRAETNGLQIVRLERGIPVRVHLVGLESLPAGLTEFGVGLEARPPESAWWRTEVHRLQAVWAGWMDEDRPTKQEWTRVRPPDDEVPLYVPVPGTYTVSWHAGWPSHGWSHGSQTTLRIGAEAAGERFEVPAPLDLLEEMGRQARGEKR